MTFGLSLWALWSITVRAFLVSSVLLGLAVLLLDSDLSEVRSEPHLLIVAFVLIYLWALGISSVLIDLSIRDHWAAWYFRTVEKPISLQLRFARSLLLIVYPQVLILAVAITHLTDQPSYQPDQLGPIFILLSAMMATYGWLYTNYANALKARHTATIEHFSEMNQSEPHREYANALKQFIGRYSQCGGSNLGQHTFSKEEVRDLLNGDESVELDGTTYSFRDVALYFLRHLEHVALSVRAGVYDFNLMQRQRRRRIILYHNTLINVIVRQSHAKPLLWAVFSRYQYQRGSDLWENLIWLTDRLDRDGGLDPAWRPKTLVNPRRMRPPKLHPVAGLWQNAKDVLRTANLVPPAREVDRRDEGGSGDAVDDT
jgi:hypothetical protein